MQYNSYNTKNYKYEKTFTKEFVAASLIAVTSFSTQTFASSKFDSNLGFGSRGEKVIDLQKFLIRNKYLSSEATGYFGNLTRDAVRKYQKEKGIATVGRVGPQTRKHLEDDDSKDFRDVAREREDDDDDDEHEFEYRRPIESNINPSATSTASSTVSTSTADGIKKATAVVDFRTPGTTNTMTVNVTTKSGLISEVSFTEKANDGSGQYYFDSFKAAFSTNTIIGKKISDVSLSRIGGASLTTNAFVAALKKTNI